MGKKSKIKSSASSASPTSSSSPSPSSSPLNSNSSSSSSSSHGSDATPPRVTDSSSPSSLVTGGFSSSSVSASFPYIPMSREVGSAVTSSVSSSSSAQPKVKSSSGEKWHPSSSSSPSSSSGSAPGHKRLGSLGSLRTSASDHDKQRAESLVRDIILRQSSERGILITDVYDQNAPWRTDDSLVSPVIWEEYKKYPQLTSAVLQHADPSLVSQEEVNEFSRWIALARFGEIEQNAWKIMKRICEQKKKSRALVWLDQTGSIIHDWSFLDLYSRIYTFTQYLRTSPETSKLQKGDRVILSFIPGLDFFIAFWSCLSQGYVPVPVTSIDPFNPASDVAEKLAAIVKTCTPSAYITTTEYLNAMEAGKAYREGMKEDGEGKDEKNENELPFNLYSVNWITTDHLDYSTSHDPSTTSFPDHIGSGYSLGFLQFTSGSTGLPKGVMVGHSHIVSNVAGCTEETRAGKSFEQYKKTVAVSWLPTFHDMGLMGFHIAPLLTGTPVVYFSPLDFLAQPTLWMQVCSEWSGGGGSNGASSVASKFGYKYVTTGGPPFALDLVCKKMSTTSDIYRSRLHLQGIISIILGAEPIRASTLLSFTETMQVYGFSSNSFMPAYGLAENVLHVIGKKDNTYPPHLLCVEAQSLSEGLIREYTYDRTQSIKDAVRGPQKWLVSCGEFYSANPAYWPGMRSMSGTVVVVNPSTHDELPDGQVGELWITGKCVTAGYWNNAESTSAAYSARLKSTCTETSNALIKSSFYRTGDLGAVYQNNLYITGRLKEMIIVNGTKHYPMDIEGAIASVTQPGIPVSLKKSSSPASSSSTGLPPLSPEKSLLFLRPGGILATEMENVATGKNELIVMVEMIEKQNGGSGDKKDGDATKSSSPSGSNGDKLSSSHLALANTLFKQCQYLPAVVRTPTIKCLARLGAKYMKYKKGVSDASTNNAAKNSSTSTTSSTSSSVSSSGYTTLELDAVEKCIRRTVMGRFGIPVADVILLRPRSILKTSSGKIRRAATCSLLVEGGLREKLIRRSSDKVAGAAGGAVTSAAQQWIAKPTISSAGAAQEKESSSKLNSISNKQPLITEKKKQLGVILPGSNKRTSSASSAAPTLTRTDSEFEIVGHSPSASASPSSSSSLAVSSPPLDFDDVKCRVSIILGEELSLDSETVLLLSQSFQFNEETTLDEYGLDSLTAMKIAGRLTHEFKLILPISPFMFFSDPTLDGMVKLIMRLKDEKLNMKKITNAKEYQQRMNGGVEEKKEGKGSEKKDDVKQDSSNNMKKVDEAKVKQPLAAKAPSSSSSSSSSSSNSSSIDSSSSSYSSLPYILGLGCCVPGPGAPQSAIMDVMVSDMQLPEKKAKLFQKIGESAGIDRRYSVLPSIEAIYFGKKGLGNDENIEVRNSIFKTEAPALSLDSARAAILDWGGDKDDITHVVAVTCTGIIVPGLEFQILSGLGLNEATQRLSVQFMGCFGALSGMKAARAFAAESPSHRVLLVCTELCSLHMQLDDRIDNLVGSALFADGSGAMIVGAQPRSGERPMFEMHRNASLIIPDTLDMMAWELTCTGMSIGLGKEIPDQIYQYIDSFSAGMLAQTAAEEVKFNECLWALHPGGPMILTAISDRLGLSSIHTSSAWNVLRKYGNMSSATLIFVLREILQQFSDAEVTEGILPENCSQFIPALAFGPGLNVEGCLLRYVGPVGVQKKQ